MSTSDELSAAAAAQRQERERNTAATAALNEVLRSGGVITQGGLKRWAEQRIDGTSMTLREHPDQIRGGTNQNDHLTQSATPIQTNREDY